MSDEEKELAFGDSEGEHDGNGKCPYCGARWEEGLVTSPVW